MCFLPGRPNHGRENGSNGDLVQRNLFQQAGAPKTVVFSTPDPAAAHCQPTPPTHCPGDSWILTGKSGSVLMGSLLPSPGSWCAQDFLCALQDSSNPTGLQSQILWGFSIPLPDPQVGKSVVGPRTFAIVL